MSAKFGGLTAAEWRWMAERLWIAAKELKRPGLAGMSAECSEIARDLVRQDRKIEAEYRGLLTRLDATS